MVVGSVSITGHSVFGVRIMFLIRLISPGAAAPISGAHAGALPPEGIPPG
jgi:hypothetical protein